MLYVEMQYISMVFHLKNAARVARFLDGFVLPDADPYGSGIPDFVHSYEQKEYEVKPEQTKENMYSPKLGRESVTG